MNENEEIQLTALGYHVILMTDPEAQPELFDGMPTTPSAHTRTLSLWDTSYKYVAAKRLKTTEKPEILVRPAGAHTLEIKPALLLRAGKTIAVYPGVREEMLVRAITYMAFQRLAETRIGQSKNGDSYLCLKFSIKDLRKVLIGHGHTYSVAQLSEAIEVCGSAVLTYRCNTETHRGEIGGPIIQSWSGTDALNDTTGEHSIRRVVLHPMVTESLLHDKTRTIDFARVMRLKSSLARWIYDRLSHNFTQAVKLGSILGKGYNLSLHTIVAETGMVGTDLSDLTKGVRKALHELEIEGVLQKGQAYQEDIRYGAAAGGRPPMTDVLWTLYPSGAVVEDILAENKARRTEK